MDYLTVFFLLKYFGVSLRHTGEARPPPTLPLMRKSPGAKMIQDYSMPGKLILCDATWPVPGDFQ
jgi:hypothetical protein